MIRLALLLAIIAAPAFADARQTAKFVAVSKAPGSLTYARGCGSYEVVTATLSGKYGEARVGRGLGDGAVIEIYASKASASWTVIVITPDGTTCITAAGTAWLGRIGEAS